MSAITLHATHAETSSGMGNSMSPATNTLIGMFINVSAVSGVLPTLIVKLQESPNGTDWYDVSGMVNGNALAVTGLTSISAQSNQLIADNVRLVWTIGGVNPSFTFEVELETL